MIVCIPIKISPYYKLEVQINWLKCQLYHSKAYIVVDQAWLNNMSSYFAASFYSRYYYPFTMDYFKHLNIQVDKKVMEKLCRQQEEFIVRYAYSETQKINKQNKLFF